MKSILLVLCSFVSFVLVSAQKISFDKTTIDYGKIGKYSDGERVFVVTNKGDKPLIITSIKASCGCTTPKWDKKPILPGKTAKIEVGYDTKIQGEFKKLIEVYSNDPENQRSVIWITGVVKDSSEK